MWLWRQMVLGVFRLCFRMPEIGQLTGSLDRTAGPTVACLRVRLEIGLCHCARMLTNAIQPLGLYLGRSNCSSENKINTGLYLVAHAYWCRGLGVRSRTELIYLVKSFKKEKKNIRMEMLSKTHLFLKLNCTKNNWAFSVEIAAVLLASFRWSWESLWNSPSLSMFMGLWGSNAAKGSCAIVIVVSLL